MQHRYAGDIGDYVKLAILRALMTGRSLGIAWWLFPNESHNSDGRHVGYLARPAEWRDFDPDLFDHLREMLASGVRRVDGLQDVGLLLGATFFGEVIPTVGSAAERLRARSEWFERLATRLVSCDLVFVDPDNSFETKGFSRGAAKAGKSVSLDELRMLRRPGRTLIVYHHQTRMPGGHLNELAHWGDRLRV